jgi:V8-like Glu-specific endopeptidase
MRVCRARVSRPGRTPASAAIRVLTALTALLLVGACAAAPGSGPPHLLGRGPAKFWNRSRLLRALPLRSRTYRAQSGLGQSAQADENQLSVRVGALFVQVGSADHFCTASVVDSPGRDLLITAAHCIYGGSGVGYRKNIVFIPDYRDGLAPYGIWTPRDLLVAPQWISDADPSLDVGFVVLKPYDGQNIEDILGANRLAFNPGYRSLVRVTGYPASGDAPITCRNWTSELSITQLRFECDGFTGGTSGSPWVTQFDRVTRTGTIVGVIGGYQQGGDTSAVSYSSYLSPTVEHLYQQAIAAEAPPTA